MFRKNSKHQQIELFGINNTLPKKLLDKLYNSAEYHFYNVIFCKINENLFSTLYSDEPSRPNARINCMIAALLLKEKYHCSYRELFDKIHFDVLTKTALGLDAMDDIPFTEATLFNFQNRLLKHQLETGEFLMEQLFDGLTESQLKELKIKTDIQRTDSFMASSNIRSYGRLQLLIEVLRRLWRILDEDDKKKLSERLLEYTNKTSGQYIYQLRSEDLPKEIEKIAELYQYLKKNIISKYEDTEYFKIFDRVYTEHFTEVDERIEVKANEDISSSSLQSPDDLDATYRKKRGESYHGQSINVTETASPGNPINLITDIEVNANNIDDSEVLNKKIDRMKEKTPELEEMHTDGGYGSIDNDLRFGELGIRHVQTAVRGRQSGVDLTIEKLNESAYKVKCPLQEVKSGQTRTRHKAMFDVQVCKMCEYSSKCPLKQGKKYRIYYFTEEDYLRNKRNRNILEIPRERRKIRPNVEATVSEFTCRMRKKKMKIRGRFKTQMFAYSMGIMINFGRLYRYNIVNNKNMPLLLIKCIILIYFKRNIREIIHAYDKIKNYLLLISQNNIFTPNYCVF
jgi:hypothetical protein